MNSPLAEAAEEQAIVEAVAEAEEEAAAKCSVLLEALRMSDDAADAAEAPAPEASSAPLKLLEEKKEAAAYHKALAESISPEHRQAKRNHRASAKDLADGRTDLSGPSCLVRAMVCLLYTSDAADE